MLRLNLLSVAWGSSIELTATLTDAVGAPIAAATAIDIWFTGKRYMTDLDNAAVFQVTKTGGGITVGGASLNVLTVRVQNVAAALANRAVSLTCDLKIKFSDGFEAVIARGQLLVVEAVTLSG